MLHLRTIALREIKLGFRNPWAYSFMVLFALFSLALLLIQSRASLDGYTSTTGTMINLILYLLPLMTMLLGSFSLTSEKEEGGWRLLSSFSLRSSNYLWGKYAGLAVVLLLIVAFGFGLSGVIGALFNQAFEPSAFGQFLLFSAVIILMFLGIAVLIGAVCHNRWQALTYGVGVWFFFILGWPTILMSFLGFLPYLWIKPALVSLIFINPAELNRLFLIVKMGGGSILGPEYYQWVEWIQKPSGSLVFAGICCLWILVYVGLATWVWERGRKRE
ncbi:ABC transporter permease [Cohnella thailandensis]|uniref:ABC transporter permease n=1 Tax=Cohnella thailandensis TaxID=557557 RepID=A0A841T0I8_9BACL|nr:ABC transporter permease [Cohnella thailandensis]MBB6637052.1 ABC transporter permease [Cohnella thailandensis]MBP1973061.1 Cu-processing system permease protein [Cohnella thailandensis]